MQPLRNPFSRASATLQAASAEPCHRRRRCGGMCAASRPSEFREERWRRNDSSDWQWRVGPTVGLLGPAKQSADHTTIAPDPGVLRFRIGLETTSGEIVNPFDPSSLRLFFFSSLTLSLVFRYPRNVIKENPGPI